MTRWILLSFVAHMGAAQTEVIPANIYPKFFMTEEQCSHTRDRLAWAYFSTLDTDGAITVYCAAVPYLVEK